MGHHTIQIRTLYSYRILQEWEFVFVIILNFNVVIIDYHAADER